jgi:hypothetical protein
LNNRKERETVKKIILNPEARKIIAEICVTAILRDQKEKRNLKKEDNS